MTRAIELLAEELDLDPSYIAHAYRISRAAFAADHRRRFPHVSMDAYVRITSANRFAETCVAATAMRLAGRPNDSAVLLNIQRAMTTAPEPLPGAVGALPEDAQHPLVRNAVHILRAAGLPPLQMNGIAVTHYGFQVVPALPELPGCVFVGPDPDADTRTGFAGGRWGCARVLQWAGWLIAPQDVENDVIGAIHPDYVPEVFNR
ncbi:hypothetical protein Sipo8835_37290 [Streptomyces ipomoeae]|uniref:Uncharacterized protein n=1 Tax=Streptomyces ipomoeae TaxID=103232 RepID=A0AAE8VXZ9_9ACTN|nr:hypothetical protein [Streptomyces ipomoeae]TQE21609.1 hypothetical protein Sipo8835_37290 [Streptomyces ipomoeae]